MAEDKKPLEGEILPPRKKLGRPKGAKDAPKKAEISRARSTGKLPSAIMLDNARYLQGLAAKYQPMKADGTPNAEANEAKLIDLLIASTECAAKAAPYYEYRLASVKVSSEPLDLSRLSDEQLDQLIAIRAALDDAGPAGREGATIN